MNSNQSRRIKGEQWNEFAEHGAGVRSLMKTGLPLLLFAGLGTVVSLSLDDPGFRFYVLVTATIGCWMFVACLIGLTISRRHMG